jgi:hypothetical protein
LAARFQAQGRSPNVALFTRARRRPRASRARCEMTGFAKVEGRDWDGKLASGRQSGSMLLPQRIVPDKFIGGGPRDVFGVPLPAAPPRAEHTRIGRSKTLRDAASNTHLQREVCVTLHPAHPIPPTRPIPAHEPATTPPLRGVPTLGACVFSSTACPSVPPLHALLTCPLRVVTISTTTGALMLIRAGACRSRP